MIMNMMYMKLNILRYLSKSRKRYKLKALLIESCPGMDWHNAE